MKITRRDLEEPILEKLDQFDSITSIPYENTDGFISYSKDKGFFFKKTNDTYLRKLYEEDDLLELANSLYHKKSNVKSSAFVDMRVDQSKYLVQTESLLTNCIFSVINTKTEKIRLLREDQNRFLLLDNAGYITKIENGKELYSINILEKLSDIFAISGLGIFDITDIAFSKDGFYLSIIEKGIFSYHEENQSIEMIVAAEGIKMFRLLPNNKIFAITDAACTTYLIASGKKVETSYILRNTYQLPFLVNSKGRDMFLIGKTMVRNASNLVHLWREDKAGISFNNRDNIIAPNKTSSEYEIRFVCQDSGFLYISGLYHGKLFVWKYDVDYLHREPEEIIFDCLENFDGITGLVCYKDQFLISIKNRLYGIQNNTVCLNLKFPSNIDDLYFFENGLFAISGKELCQIFIPKYEQKLDIVKYNILDEVDSCNNIDIMVLGTENNEEIKLENKNGEIIFPTAMFVSHGNTVIKLLNCKELLINLKIQVTLSSNIRGIVVKKNRIFLR